MCWEQWTTSRSGLEPSVLELSVCGQFYQGFVDDYTLVLVQHCMATVSTYGVRKSRKNAVQVMEDKENDNGDQTDLKVSSTLCSM